MFLSSIDKQMGDLLTDFSINWTDATFSENFYGLRRIPLRKESENEDADKPSDSLTVLQRWRSLLMLVSSVYICSQLVVINCRILIHSTGYK